MVGLENSTLSSCKIVAFVCKNSRGSISPAGVGAAKTRRFTPNMSRSRVTSLVMSWPAPKPQRRPAAVWTVDRSHLSIRLAGPMRSRRESAIATGRQASAYPRYSEPQSTILRSWVGEEIVLRGSDALALTTSLPIRVSSQPHELWHLASPNAAVSPAHAPRREPSAVCPALASSAPAPGRAPPRRGVVLVGRLSGSSRRDQRGHVFARVRPVLRAVGSKLGDILNVSVISHGRLVVEMRGAVTMRRNNFSGNFS